MSINPSFSFSCERLDRIVSTGYVDNINWRLTGIHTVGVGTEAVTYTNSVYGSHSLGPEPVGFSTSNDFVEYENITLNIVETWWTGSIGTDRVNELKEGITNVIERKITPIKASGLPW